MAGLVRFSDAISSSVSDWRRYSLRMSCAMSGSTLSSALKDIVTIGAAICLNPTRRPESGLHAFGGARAGSAGLWWRRSEHGGGWDRALAQDVQLRAREFDHSRRRAARGAAAVQYRRQAWQLAGLL